VDETNSLNCTKLNICHEFQVSLRGDQTEAAKCWWHQCTQGSSLPLCSQTQPRRHRAAARSRHRLRQLWDVGAQRTRWVFECTHESLSSLTARPDPSVSSRDGESWHIDQGPVFLTAASQAIHTCLGPWRDPASLRGRRRGIIAFYSAGCGRLPRLDGAIFWSGYLHSWNSWICGLGIIVFRKRRICYQPPIVSIAYALNQRLASEGFE
jgi:hypothetical protein